MLKVADAIKEIIGRNPVLQFGISHQLFNLSQLSRYLVAQIAARTKKEVQPSAVLMALSRYQRAETKKRRGQPQFSVRKLSVNSGLVVATYSKSPTIHKAVNNFYTKVQNCGGFFTVNEGTAQITTIFEADYLQLRKSLIKERAVKEYRHIGSLSVRFEESYLETPGFLYFVLQQLYLQNINVVELTSTATEIIVFLAEEDVRLALDTLYNKFS